MGLNWGAAFQAGGRGLENYANYLASVEEQRRRDMLAEQARQEQRAAEEAQRVGMYGPRVPAPVAAVNFPGSPPPNDTTPWVTIPPINTPAQTTFPYNGVELSRDQYQNMYAGQAYDLYRKEHPLPPQPAAPPAPQYYTQSGNDYIPLPSLAGLDGIATVTGQHNGLPLVNFAPDPNRNGGGSNPYPAFLQRIPDGNGGFMDIPVWSGAPTDQMFTTVGQGSYGGRPMPIMVGSAPASSALTPAKVESFVKGITNDQLGPNVAKVDPKGNRFDASFGGNLLPPSTVDFVGPGYREQFSAAARDSLMQDPSLLVGGRNNALAQNIFNDLQPSVDISGWKYDKGKNRFHLDTPRAKDPVMEIAEFRATFMPKGEPTDVTWDKVRAWADRNGLSPEARAALGIPESGKPMASTGTTGLTPTTQSRKVAQSDMDAVRQSLGLKSGGY